MVWDGQSCLSEVFVSAAYTGQAQDTLLKHLNLCEQIPDPSWSIQSKIMTTENNKDLLIQW